MKHHGTLASCMAPLAAAFVISIAASPAEGRSPLSPDLEVIGHSNQVTRYVSYADLNLAIRPEERTLVRRVSVAVNQVCDEAVGRSEPAFYNGCTFDAWTGARPQIALAVQRAREVALTGTSSLAATAITINISPQ